LTKEAIASALRAARLDPFNIVVQRDLGRSYYFDRQFDRAVEQFLRNVEVAPENRLTHLFLGIAYERVGREADAVEEIARASDLYGNPGMASAMREAFARGGYRAFARTWAELSEALVERGGAQHTSVAMIYARAGETDKAFAWLEKGYEARSRALVLLRTEPQFESLRGDPRYADLVRRMRLPE
jgi:tetratricopeptide (TPR) repeat protein